MCTKYTEINRFWHGNFVNPFQCLHYHFISRQWNDVKIEPNPNVFAFIVRYNVLSMLLLRCVSTRC